MARLSADAIRGRILGVLGILALTGLSVALFRYLGASWVLCVVNPITIADAIYVLALVLATARDLKASGTPPRDHTGDDA